MAAEQRCIDTEHVVYGTDGRGPYMTLSSGRQYHPFTPSATEISLEDEAHALAATPRFGGHCRTFSYSVAHHSVLVSLIAEAIVASDDDPESAAIVGLQGLHHDGAEAVVGDLPAPVKHHIALASYREVEHLNLAPIEAIARVQLGVKPSPVACADQLMLRIEMRDLTLCALDSVSLARVKMDLDSLRVIALLPAARRRHAGSAAAAAVLDVVDCGWRRGCECLDPACEQKPRCGCGKGLLGHGLYGQPAMDLFIARHKDLVARRAAAVERNSFLRPEK